MSFIRVFWTQNSDTRATIFMKLRPSVTDFLTTAFQVSQKSVHGCLTVESWTPGMNAILVWWEPQPQKFSLVMILLFCIFSKYFYHFISIQNSMFRVNIKPENFISTWNMKVYLEFLPILAWAWSRSFDIFSSWVLSLFVSLVFELIIFFIWFISSRSLSISRFESSKWEVIESSSASCACKAVKKILCGKII